MCSLGGVGFVAPLAVALMTSAAASAQSAPAAISLDAGNGERLLIDRAPFRLSLVARDGNVSVATVAGAQGPPVRVPGVDGPQPLEPVGALGGYPALGFVVGADAGVANPLPPFTGNRLFGAEAGALVSVVRVLSSAPAPGGLRLALGTDDPGLGAATLEIARLPAGGVTLALRAPPGLAPVATMFTLASPPDEALYGLGTRRDAFNQRGLLRNVWVEEQYLGWQTTEPITGLDPTGTTGPAYTFPNGPQAAFFVQSALTGSRGWTAWVSQPALQRLDLGSSRADTIRWGVASDHLTLSLAGGGIERSVRSYTAVAGRAPAPPRYVYEPWLDRINENGEGEAAPNGGGFTGGAAVEADLKHFSDLIRRLDLPIRTLGVEGWQAVPDAQTLFPGLRRAGFDLVAYWNPFLAPGKPATDEALALGIVVKGVDGKPYPVITNRDNTSYVVDFSNPGALAFWKRQIARSCDLGFEGTHADFGEFVTDGMRFYDGTPPALMHNRYPVLYAQATRAALAACAAAHPGLQPFFYVRSGYSATGSEAGTLASTPAVIVGDETTDWSRGSGIASIPPAMLNLAIGGGSTFISDVGGYLDLYTPPTSAELFTRWAQLSALTPVMRIHDDTYHGSVYPWSFDRATLDTYRRYAKLHARLADLVQRWSQRAASDGTIGPVRPLALDDPSGAARSIDDEWLLGRDVLAAPVLVQGARARSVYLPAGASWQRMTVGDAGQFVAVGTPEPGGRRVNAPAPLTDIPIFVRAGGTDMSTLEGQPCRSARRLTITVPRRRGLRVVRIDVLIDGRRTARLAGPHRRVRVDLRGRASGSYRVTVVAHTVITRTDRSGPPLVAKHTIRTCQRRAARITR